MVLLLLPTTLTLIELIGIEVVGVTEIGVGMDVIFDTVKCKSCFPELAY